MKEYKVDGHFSSFLPEGKEWKLVWNDEFDVTELDKTKWDFRLHMMGERHRTWTEDDGIELDGNSNLIFTIIEKDCEICSCQLATGHNYMDAPVDNTYGGLKWRIGKFRKQKYLHSYGYYECRCRPQKKEGWWSAFWLQSPIIGCCDKPEIAGVECDIMESFHPGMIIDHTNHYDGYGLDHKTAKSKGGADKDITLDEWHTFGVLWNEDGYTFYVDGEADGHIDGPVSKQDQFILISTEVNGYRTEAREASAEARDAMAAGDTFVVDYVRVFDEI